MITADEAMAGQSFPTDTQLPENHRPTMHMTGNTVRPLAKQHVNDALLKST